MGFKLPQTHYRLFFEDESLEGLEVTMSRIPIGASLRLDVLTSMVSGTLTAQQREKAYQELADILGEHLISWNLEDKAGIPVPADAKGILTQPAELIDQIIGGYVQAIRGVPAPLDQSSNGGQPSGQPSIPMEPLPASPSS